MSRYHGNDQQCPGCGMRYGDFRTGLTFVEVRSWLLDESDDRRDWKYKRRGTVLGLWHETKLRMWDRHIAECAGQAEVEPPALEEAS